MDGVGRRARVLIAKIGLDGHDRGARIVARALRDAGMEVIYTGRHVSTEAIASIAVAEDVDIVGVSILSGAHVPLVRSLVRALEAAGIRDEVDVVAGGTVSTRATRDELFALGVADVFAGGTPLPDVVRRVEEIALRRAAGRR
ncbi:MAG: methylmalonyl-CoA mutase [Actinophytocola sp.]|uniref:cobalamin B12-binding domain-containing protein n=1 Tax=Actinophytocola sp. TaxID=1872138 RepID=UPI00132A3199|nr:cobalamin-dependent protein [Actinophytocola sp.]MPZ80072.1 methylmalonyl-CoA mutase [Actinophytocola sp.]